MSKEEIIQLLSTLNIDKISYFNLTYFTQNDDEKAVELTFEK